MPGFPGLEVVLVLWGVAVLAYAAVRHIYFGGLCIQIEGPAHRTELGACAACGRD